MIIHVDMDAFFAAIEQRDFPELRGRPVLVGGDSARGVVAAASYEARRFGCHSAQPMREALRRCPDAVVRPSRFEAYRQAAEQIREIFHSATPLVEPISLDEAFLDVTASFDYAGTAEEIGQRLKQQIRAETDLVASVGIGPVKFVAKLASDLGKPDGFVAVAADDVLDFLAPLPVSRLWGVGKATLPKLKALGIERIEQIRAYTPEALEARFGKLGRHLWNLAYGQDPRPVVSERQAKSISHERTFETDQTDEAFLIAVLHQLTDEVAMRLRKNGLLARSAFLKVRFENFQTVTRQVGWEEASDQTRPIWHHVRDLWQQEARWRGRAIRLLGVGLSGLIQPSEAQPSLFTPPEEEQDRRMDRTIDAIRHRFGLNSLRSADSLPRKPHS